MLAYLRRPEQLDDQVALQLLDAAADLPLELCTRPQLNALLRAAEVLSGRESLTVQAAAMLLLDHVHTSMPRQKRPLKILQEMDCGNMSLALLREDICAGGLTLQEAQVSDIFLDNLKTATPWIIKQVNLRLLTDDARNDHGSALHIATHLSNLIKVSDRVTVRHGAGLALLEIAPRLTVDQRNEVSVELCRGLELGQQEFTKYIPDYLGRLALWLPPEQLDECLADLGVTLSASSSRIVTPVLDTVGVIYEEYDVYHQRFPEEAEETCLRRRDRLLGMLMRGLAGIDGETRQEAMLVLGQRVFGSAQLSNGEKSRAFPLTARKLLTTCRQEDGDALSFYYRASMLGRLYRFLTAQRLRGGFTFEAPRPIAFFPGTFDPFTLSHKAIVRTIRDRGFEVLLAIDEFSWSKRTQPYRIRRRIAAMSVADEFHVQIFPEDFPVNIANPENLHRLRQAFPGSKC